MKEAIILAGGFGTRLQSAVKDVPKCMAPVDGKPFLSYLFRYAGSQRIEHIVLSLGYMAEVIIDWLGQNTFPFEISYVIENEPLGTGGAIKYAFSKIKGGEALIINGDTFFDVDTNELTRFNASNSADISIALKPMTDFDRYGSVEIGGDQRIIKFNEKQFRTIGLINGGIYVVNRDIFTKISLPDKFSFEKDILEQQLDFLKIYGCIQDRYFIDIGIPSDYEKANIDFKKLF